MSATAHRKVTKLPYVCPALVKKVMQYQEGKVKKIETKSRRSTIYPEFVGSVLHVHNGKGFVPVSISESMVGHKLGEFAATRKFGGHKTDKTKK